MFNINELASEELRLINIAEYKYGDFYYVTRGALEFLWKFHYKTNMSCWMFLGFTSQVQKSLYLSFLSALRNHDIQTNMMLRYSLESASLALYSMYKRDENEFHAYQQDGTVLPKEALKASYKWLAENYPEFSRKMKKMKDSINKFSTHGNSLPSIYNVEYTDDDKAFISFFDKEHNDFIKMRLWWIADICFGFLQMVSIINEKHQAVKLVDNFDEVLVDLGRRIKHNEVVLRNTDTFKKIFTAP